MNGSYGTSSVPSLAKVPVELSGDEMLLRVLNTWVSVGIRHDHMIF
jgi:hypothetical protein